ncbi:ABC transporter ATP-binding protein [Rhizohabitans arisaemae]|uniref:ABC transporter ATP-binding protein n=1 Tax=Rhizohabitans arisaemae TaxID=2720610 RepID=UPI0024B26003|nr:ABC transporter ATP-binding protein [Rhizohabitans arisaemae]
MIVEVHNVTVRYQGREKPALTSVDLTVESGELTLVSGPSGCGKSTLLRLLNGLVPHSYRTTVDGEVLVGGKSTAKQTIRQISTVVGTMLQDPQKQIVGTTVEADIAFGLENSGVDRGSIRRRIDEVADQVGIGHLLGRASAELSGGELQMVAFAGVLAMRPKMIVVDEPLANLDPRAGSRLLRAIRAFVDDGGAAVVVEHRVEELLEIRPDTVLYLEEGRTQYSGPMEGFLRAAPVGHVKLPFEVLVSRAAELPEPVQPPPATPRPGDEPRLSFHDVDLGYGSRVVLRDVGLGLAGHERVAVLGANGAGKSTLLRAAVRLVEPTRGEVRVDGDPVRERSILSLATTFGYVFQSPGQALFSPTVAEELAFGPRNLGWDKKKITEVSRTALETMLLAEEPGILKRPPRTLSFGQQRRLTVALALAMCPRTLILDEPTAGQDLRTTTEFMARVNAIDSVESVYFITHDVDLALTGADRIIVVDRGRIVADATPVEIAKDEGLWTRSALRETSLVRAARAHPPGQRSLAHPFALARTHHLATSPEGNTLR